MGWFLHFGVGWWLMVRFGFSSFFVLFAVILVGLAWSCVTRCRWLGRRRRRRGLGWPFAGRCRRLARSGLGRFFPGHRPGPYTQLMIAGPPSWSRQRPHDGSRGFQPTGGIIHMRLRRGATLEKPGLSDTGLSHQASRSDAIPSRWMNRGLKTHGYLRRVAPRQRKTNLRSIS